MVKNIYFDDKVTESTIVTIIKRPVDNYSYDLTDIQKEKLEMLSDNIDVYGKENFLKRNFLSNKKILYSFNKSVHHCHTAFLIFNMVKKKFSSPDRGCSGNEKHGSVPKIGNCLLRAILLTTVTTFNATIRKKYNWTTVMQCINSVFTHVPTQKTSVAFNIVDDWIPGFTH